MESRNETKNTVRMPMVPLRGVIALPGMMVNFDVGRGMSVAAVQIAKKTDQKLFVVPQRDIECENPGRRDLYTVGTVISIKHTMNGPDGTIRVLALGEYAAKLVDLTEEDDARYAEIRKQREDAPADALHSEALMGAARRALNIRVQSGGDVPNDLCGAADSCGDPLELFYLLVAHAIPDMREKQELYETRGITERYLRLLQILDRNTQLAQLEDTIMDRVHEAIDKNQKQFFLREKLEQIRKELGEDEESAADGLRKRLEKSPISGEAREMAERELRHLDHMAPGTPDISVSRNYIEFLLDLPWSTPAEKPMKIDKARRILEEDHYGLAKIKERVLEYLAVREIAGAQKAPILCLVGAPGVGKTSIARSIARALDRKFVRMSLGGIHDEAEIRGHRRTYIGAMPGRILSLIRRAGTNNCVFLLDEIDKLTSDMRGDPASALLEALDPEQNNTFSDHYVEAPYDLSHVLFLTTANTLDTIPAPLMDRMEILEVSSYTLEEKVQIAKRHLWPKQLEAHALKKSQVRISDEVLREVVEGYTAEAGVRTLERKLQTVLRKCAIRILEARGAGEEPKPIRVDRALLQEFLGAPEYIEPASEKQPEIGLVNGLAWTSIGGKLLTIEATVMPGSGNVELTGQLGDVMKESARTALSYLRSRSAVWSIPDDFRSRNDLHIHAPEGAVPKDGPSAGVALTCAILSAITGRPVRQDIAMTGEVTLRGRVLPIGGLKEKLLAAFRAGIRTVLIPEENKKDLTEVPADILDKMTVTTIHHVDQAIDAVLTEGTK